MEPERHIEKLLRAYARKRREAAGTPLELHPATRRMLQGEVARQYGQPTGEREAWWKTLPALWPRLAFAAATLAVLAVGLFLILPGAGNGPKPMTLAEADSAKSRPDGQRVAPMTAPVRAARAPAPAAPPPASVASAPARKKAQPVDRLVPAPTETARALQPDAKAPALESESARNLATARADGKSKGVGAPAPAAEPFGLVRTQPAPASETPSEPTGPSLAATAGRTKAFEQKEDVSTVEAPPNAYAAPRSYGAAATSKPGSSGLGAEAAAASGRVQVAVAPEATVALMADDKDGNALSFTTQPAAGGTLRDMPRQSFARVDAISKKSARAALESHAVLRSFEVEQRGQAFRIVDGDGSVYTGTVQAGEALVADAVAKTESTRVLGARGGGAERARQQAAATPSAGNQAAQNLAFRVSGSNATLRQNVVFVGNVLREPLTNQLALTNAVGGVAGVFQSPVQAQNQLSPLSNSRITGRARLADGQELEINAVPVAP